MTLDEMRKIAEQRGMRGDLRRAVPVFMYEHEFAFYMMSVKTYDNLLSIAEAAKNLQCYSVTERGSFPCGTCDRCIVLDALKKLEVEK